MLVKAMQNEIEYRIRTAAALAKAGQSVQEEVDAGRARIAVLAARGDAAPTEVEWGVRVDGEVIRRRDHGSKIASEAGARRAAREDWAPGIATPVQRTVSAWREVQP